MDLLLPAGFFAWCQTTPLAAWIMRSTWMLAVVETCHSAAFVILIAAIAAIDLRLLGLIERGQSVADVARRLAGLIAVSLIAVVVTGIALFMPHAVAYAHSVPLLVTLALFAAGIATHATVVAKATAATELTPLRFRKMAAYLSLISWLGVAVSERGIFGTP